MATKLQIRRDTIANWFLVNPLLAEGEIGFVTDTNRIKIGDGINHWDKLPYIASDSSDIEYLKTEIAKLEVTVTTKADADNVYTKDESETRFVDETELDEKSQYIIEEAFNKSKEYTKSVLDSKADASDLQDLASKVEIITASIDDLEDKIISEVNETLTNNYYNKTEVDDKINDIVIGVQKFEDSDTVHFFTTDSGKVSASVVDIYTKSETDAKIKEVSDTVVTTQSEVDKIKEKIGYDKNTTVIQISDDMALTDGAILSYNETLKQWETIPLATIREWE